MNKIKWKYNLKGKVKVTEVMKEELIYIFCFQSMIALNHYGINGQSLELSRKYTRE